MDRPSAQQIIHMLDLQPLVQEGGYYRVTWTSTLRQEGSQVRPLGSAIYYLVTADPTGFSAFHELGTDEIYHFYFGDPLELHLLHPSGLHEQVLLGSRLERGERPQMIVAAGVSQGSRLVSGGSYALLGTTMAPAFSTQDFTLNSRAELLAKFPTCEQIITALTRE
jgi:hypothetical protein